MAPSSPPPATMSGVREVERWQANAAAGKATVDEVWCGIGRLVSDGCLADSEQREIVWDSFPRKQAELRRQCPYFDPQHPVWSEKDPMRSGRAMAELSRIMADERALKKRKRGQVLILCGAIINSLAGATTAVSMLTAASYSVKFALVSAYAMSTLVSFVLHLFGVITLTKYVRVLRNLPEDAYLPVSHDRGPLSVHSHAELEYTKSWAASHNWRLRLRNVRTSDQAMWGELTRLIDGPIDKLSRLQIFWSSHSQEKQARLIESSPFFDPAHEVWRSESASETKRAELDMEIAVAAWEIRDTKRIMIAWAIACAYIVTDLAVMVSVWKPTRTIERRVFYGFFSALMLGALSTLSFACKYYHLFKRAQQTRNILIKQCSV